MDINSIFASSLSDKKVLLDTIGMSYGANDISFSGVDMRVIAAAHYEEDRVFILPKPVLLTTLTGISVSEHRDIFPVRTLGVSNPRGWSKGSKTVAGTLLFAQLGKYGLRDILKDWIGSGTINTSEGTPAFRSAYDLMSLSDLPALDFFITFVNEAGNTATMAILGAKILDEGESFTLDEQEWYTTASYMALAKLPMRADLNYTYLPDSTERGTIQDKKSGEIVYGKK